MRHFLLALLLTITPHVWAVDDRPFPFMLYSKYLDSNDRTIAGSSDWDTHWGHTYDWMDEHNVNGLLLDASTIDTLIGTASVDFATNPTHLNFSTAHGLQVNSEVMLRLTGAQVLPSPMIVDDRYFVQEVVDSDTVILSTRTGDSSGTFVVTFTDNGTDGPFAAFHGSQPSNDNTIELEIIDDMAARGFLVLRRVSNPLSESWDRAGEGFNFHQNYTRSNVIGYVSTDEPKDQDDIELALTNKVVLNREYPTRPVLFALLGGRIGFSTPLDRPLTETSAAELFAVQSNVRAFSPRLYSRRRYRPVNADFDVPAGDDAINVISTDVATDNTEICVDTVASFGPYRINENRATNEDDGVGTSMRFFGSDLPAGIEEDKYYRLNSYDAVTDCFTITDQVTGVLVTMTDDGTGTQEVKSSFRKFNMWEKPLFDYINENVLGTSDFTNELWYLFHGLGRCSEQSYDCFWRSQTEAEAESELHFALAARARALFGFSLFTFEDQGPVIGIVQPTSATPAPLVNTQGHDGTTQADALKTIGALVNGPYREFFKNHQDLDQGSEPTSSNAEIIVSDSTFNGVTFIYAINKDVLSAQSATLTIPGGNETQAYDIVLNVTVSITDGGATDTIPTGSIAAGSARIYRLR